MRDEPPCNKGRAPQQGALSTGPLDGLHDHRIPATRHFLPAEDLHRGNPTLSIGNRAKIQQDDPIFCPIDQRLDPARESDTIFSPEGASENAVLQRSAVGFREFMHLT